MEVNLILISILAMGGLGLFFAIVLSIAYKRLQVKEEPLMAKVLEALPGLNCGACGYAGCHELAEKIVSREVTPDSCPPGGAQVAEEIAKILGVEVEVKEKKVARVLCGGGKEQAVERAEYTGIQDCKAAELVGGGSKGCTYGCLGYGSCVKACPFGAITMNENRLPVVDDEKCTGCGLCIEACPRGIIVLVSRKQRVFVLCNSKDKGAVARKLCKVACIACGICTKEYSPMYVLENNLARVDFEKWEDSGERCIEKCPTKAIVKV